MAYDLPRGTTMADVHDFWDEPVDDDIFDEEEETNRHEDAGEDARWPEDA